MSVRISFDKGNGNFWECDEIYPVPLSPEWLKRGQFKKTVEITWSFGYEKKYDIWRLGDFAYNGIQAAWWYDGKLLANQPEFLHQLQNLYFALTGTELTFLPSEDTNK